jgi:hypothetical protein
MEDPVARHQVWTYDGTAGLITPRPLAEMCDRAAIGAHATVKAAAQQPIGQRLGGRPLSSSNELKQKCASAQPKRSRRLLVRGSGTLSQNGGLKVWTGAASMTSVASNCSVSEAGISLRHCSTARSAAWRAATVHARPRSVRVSSRAR